MEIDMTKYKYVGEGAGVPGLPHEISDEEAKALGVEAILKAAIENGSYVPLTPDPSPKGRGEAKKKESE